MVKIGHRSNIVIVSINRYIRINKGQSFFGGLDLTLSGLIWLKEQTIHVGHLDFIVVEQNQLSDATSCQHFGGDTSDTSNPDNGDCIFSNILSSKNEYR